MAPEDHMVFVQTNNPQGNQVRAYRRADDGALTLVQTVDTGGKGGRLAGPPSDPLGSQGSLVDDSHHRLLFAVNAGSDTISVLGVGDSHLCLRQVLPSGGTFPASLAVHGNLLYVLNARKGGSIMGYRITDDRVCPIPDSHRSLGLTEMTGPMEFAFTPAQIGFSPDGRHLIITTKAANGALLDTFAIEDGGRPSAKVTANSAATPAPFGFTFDQHGHLVVTDAGIGALSTYTLNPDGTTAHIATQPDGRQAMCWVVKAGANFYVTDNMSNTITGYRIDAAGTPTVFTDVATNDGPTELAVARHGHFLYVEAGGAGNLDTFRIRHDGTLTRVATLTGLDGLEGLVVT
jgi:6-phosphogluconolactonase (cycloisomerase 2 family)